jgi:CO dehydrogenase/acetyl-CoA synthase gamma subunit (corrinoid Fe-S protein)
MHLADLYLDEIEFLKYLPKTDCAECGFKSCEDFIEALRQGRKKPRDCPFVSPSLYYPLQIALDAENILPKVPALTVPQSGHVGLVEINRPSDGAPVLISGNNVHTQEVMTSILATTKSPFFLVFADVKGDTVDMALIYDSMTAKQITEDIRRTKVIDSLSSQEIIIPGFASTMGDELKRLTGCNVTAGPVCAAELPLFLADRWLPPDL